MVYELFSNELIHWGTRCICLFSWLLDPRSGGPMFRSFSEYLLVFLSLLYLKICIFLIFSTEHSIEIKLMTPAFEKINLRKRSEDMIYYNTFIDSEMSKLMHLHLELKVFWFSRNLRTGFCKEQISYQCARETSNYLV